MKKLATLAILLGMTTVFAGCPAETKKEPPAAVPADAPADAPPADAPAEK